MRNARRHLNSDKMQLPRNNVTTPEPIVKKKNEKNGRMGRHVSTVEETPGLGGSQSPFFHKLSVLPPDQEGSHRKDDSQSQEPQRMNGRARLRKLFLGAPFVGLLFLPFLLMLFVTLLLVIHEDTCFMQNSETYCPAL